MPILVSERNRKEKCSYSRLFKRENYDGGTGNRIDKGIRAHNREGHRGASERKCLVGYQLNYIIILEHFIFAESANYEVYVYSATERTTKFSANDEYIGFGGWMMHNGYYSGFL